MKALRVLLNSVLRDNFFSTRTHTEDPKGKEVRPVKVFFPVEFTPQTAALKVNFILHKTFNN